MKPTKKKPAKRVPKRGRPKKHSTAAIVDARKRVAALKEVRRRTATERLIGEIAFVRTWISADLLVAEPELHSLAWVEYRCLSPLERTEEFLRAYAVKYRRALVKAGKPVGAPIATDLGMNTVAEMNALWRARAEADRLGVPYELFLDVVIDGHINNDKWKRPPRPNQLYGKLAEPRLRSRPTAAEAADRIATMATNPLFGVDAYTGATVQEAALDILRSDIEAAPNPVSRLGLYLVDWRMITRDRAEAMFGSVMVDAVISLRGEPVAVTPVRAVGLQRPGCFGHHRNGESASCRQCDIRTECADLGSEVESELIRVTGTDNPRLAHKRRVDRERQRRYRQKRERTLS